MTKNVWDMDAVKRQQIFQQREDAIARDKTPRPEEVPPLVVIRHIASGMVEARFPAEAEALIASGEYRPFQATENWSANGALSCQADPNYVEQGRKERIAAIARLLAEGAAKRAEQEDFSAVESRIASMSEDEVSRLEAELMQPVVGVASGLVRAPQ